MFATAALLALAAPPPASPEPVRARAQVMALVKIVIAAEVRDGRTAEPHQPRRVTSPEGRPLTLIEFE
jgi:hypothetical protein